MMATVDRDKALEAALAQIDKHFGKGSVMRLGDETRLPIQVIPTGSIALDVALGIGGLPRGRIVEVYGPESSGKCLTADTHVWTDLGLETVAELFERCGQPVDATPRVTDVSDLGVRLVNERGELELLAGLTHNGARPTLRVRLESGRGVTATANHPLRVLTEQGEAVWRPMAALRAGDVLVCAGFGAAEAALGDGLSEADALALGDLLAGPTDRAGEGQVPGVPRCVRTAGAKIQASFLSALFHGADRPAEGRFGFTSADPQLVSQVQLLLLGLGVTSAVSPAGVGLGAAAPGRGGWTVAVDPQAIPRFLEVVGAAGHPDGLSRPDRSVPDGGYVYERVLAVEDAGAAPTFDVVLPSSHSFLANGVVSHNTTVALHAVANAQAAGGIAAFIDAEHALDPVYAKALGVDTDALLVSQPDTGEQALEIADMLVRSGAIDVVVIDSVAALVPRAEIEGEMGDSHVGLQARLMSQALRKMTGALSNTGTTAIFINQLREKIGVVYGSPEVTSGGKALKFYATIRIDVRRIETLKEGTEAVGNRTRAKVVKNKVSPPFRQAEFDIIYGEGISREGGLIDVGVDNGLVRKSGAWYTYEGDQLGQGKENARQFLRDNPDLANEIEKRIKEKLGIGPVLDAETAVPPPVDF
jgi:recombination protein RecA